MLVAWLVWLIDVGSKTLALAHLEGKAPVKLLGDFLKLTLVKNSGAAFSIGTGAATLLSAFAILVIIAIGYWSPKITSLPWGYVLGLVLGGSLGNLTDRIFRSEGGLGSFRGYVIDWIELPRWPIFNLADSAIVIAAVIAAFLSIRNVAPISSVKTFEEGDDVNGA